VDASEFGTVSGTSRMIVSGCPATYTTVDLGSLQSTPLTLHILALHPPGSENTYFFVGSPMGDFTESDMRRELANIRDSIRIVHAGSKRTN